MAVVNIQTTVMGFSLGVMPNGIITGTTVNITGYSKKFVHKEFNRKTFAWDFKGEYFYYDFLQKRCYFARFDLDNFKSFLSQNGLTWNITERPGEPGKPVRFEMMPFVEYKNERQENAVKFLTNPESGPLRALSLQTGGGKTVSFIWALQKLGVRSMIKMTSRLKQWVAEIVKFTTVDEDDIFLIQGVGSLTKLFDQLDKKIFPKIILVSSATLRLYMKYDPSYQHLPHPTEMCEKLGIGIVAGDEEHEHFMTNFLSGILLNPAVFMPITATFNANDPFIKNILNQFYPKDVQFVGGEYKRYVDVYAYNYRSNLHIKPFYYSSPKGYSQQAFEKFLMSPRGKPVLDRIISDAILPMIKEHYINIAEDGERFLFLCSSIKLCDHLAGVLKRTFKHKTVSVFYSGMPETVLERYDIILSTPGSAGTGRDIKNLRTCFAFESTGSSNRNLQFIGRLRDYPAVKNTPVFLTLSFSCIPQHQKYNTERAMLYGPRAKNFTHRSIA